MASEPPIAGSSSSNNEKIDEVYHDLINENKNDDFEINRKELEQLKKALKDEQFRKLLTDYVDDVRDPENQKLFQSELKQLERERGNIVHFINPMAGYVLKTSLNGDKKAFINICSNPLLKKPNFEAVVQDNVKGSMWNLPYTQTQGRDDYDKSGKKCMVYDVVFHPDALELANKKLILQNQLEATALEAVETQFNIKLDKVNIRRPKLKYKGMKTAVTIKYKIGDSPPHVIDPKLIGNEPPPEKDEPRTNVREVMAEKSKNDPPSSKISEDANHAKKPVDYSNWTVPKYKLTYRSHVDMQNYCTEFQRTDPNSNIPDEIVIIVDLPMLKDSSTLDADVIDDGDTFELKSDERALYYLKVKIPYKVIPETSKATFDKDTRKLTVCMKILKKKPQNPGIEMLNSVETDNDGAKEKEVPSSNNLPLQPVLEEPFEDSGEYSVSPDACSSLIGSPMEKKTVRFNDEVQRLLYRSNSSILGQRKKNQRKAMSKRKARERLNSVESISSYDEEEDTGGRGDCYGATVTKSNRERFNSGESVSSFDEDELIAKFSSSY